MKSFKQFILLTEAKPKDLVDYVYKRLESKNSFYDALSLTGDQLNTKTPEEVKTYILDWLEALYNQANYSQVPMKYYDWMIKSLVGEYTNRKTIAIFNWNWNRKFFSRSQLVSDFFNPRYEDEVGLNDALKAYEKISRLKLDTDNIKSWERFGYKLTGDIYKDFPVNDEPFNEDIFAQGIHSIFALGKINQDELVSQKEKDRAVKQDAKLVDTVNGYEIRRITSYASNCLYGANTKWCTTAKEGPSYFDRYNKAGHLYIINSPDKKEKWQLYIPNDKRAGIELNDDANNIVKGRDKIRMNFLGKAKLGDPTDEAAIKKFLVFTGQPDDR